MIALLSMILALILFVLCTVSVDLARTVRADLRARRARHDDEGARHDVL